MPSLFEEVGDDNEDEVCKEAKDLSPSDLRKELEARDISATGFWSDDVKRLQIEYYKEFEEQAAERAKRKQHRDHERKVQAGERIAKAALQKEAREEANELDNNDKLSMILGLVRENKTPSAVSLVCDSVLVRAIAKNMISSSCNSIISLDISRSNLNDDAGSHLAKMIGSNSSIQLLNLELNNLGPPTASAFGKHLKTNNTLKYLCLEGNNLTSAEESIIGVKDLADSLKYNKSLTNLNLWRCMIGKEGSGYFSSALEKNDTLLSLDIGGSTATVSDLQSIAKSLHRNKSRDEAIKVKNRNIRRQLKKENAVKNAEAEGDSYYFTNI